MIQTKIEVDLAILKGSSTKVPKFPLEGYCTSVLNIYTNIILKSRFFIYVAKIELKLKKYLTYLYSPLKSTMNGLLYGL